MKLPPRGCNRGYSENVVNFQPTRIELGWSSGLSGLLVDSITPVTGSPLRKELQGMSSQYKPL